MKRILLLLVLLTSCTRFTPPSTRILSPETAAFRHEVVESIRERNGKVRSLRSFTTIRFGLHRFGRRGEAAILIRAPSDLRLDSLSESGQTDLQVGILRGDLLIYRSGENRYWKGIAARDRLAHTLRISLDPEAIVQLMLGVVPLEEEEYYRLQKVKGRGRLLLRGRSGELVVETREGGNLPVRYTAFAPGGGRRYTVTYDDYVDVDGIPISHRFEARFWDPASRIEVRYRDPEVNPRLDSKLFQWKVPDDATSVDTLD